MSPNQTLARLIFLHAQTSLHPGAGSALGAIDLPIQRERHTQWPLIPSSSLKGVLRDACRRAVKDNIDKEMLYSAFGPESSDVEDHCGALSFTDVRLIAFPVRSLRGVFAWVTCPTALERLARDLTLAGAGGNGAADPAFEEIPKPPRGGLACDPQSPILITNQGKAVLEEFEFVRAEREDAAGVADWLAEHAIPKEDEATRRRLKTHLAILHDDDFTHFVRYATEVLARIGLDPERKTVKQGALFYQEFLPPETILYSIVIAEASRRRQVKLDASAMLEYLTPLPPVLQIGANETTGKGLCATNLVTAGKESNS